MTRRIAIYSGALALLFATPALAHHPGGASNTGGAGPINTISATTLEARHGAVAFLYEYLKFGGIGDADLVGAAGKHIHAHSIGTIRSAVMSGAYGITDDLMVSVRAPYVHRTDIREGHHAHGAGGAAINTVDFRGDSSGVGDVTLLGQWRFLNNAVTRTEMAFLFGLKLPTGATNRIDRLGNLFETEFQPGSGSVDVLIGGAFTQRFGAWSFDANVLGGIAGRGTQDINLGDRLQYNAAASYRLIGYTAPASLTSSVMSHGPVPHRHAHPLDKVPVKPPAPEWTVDAVLELNGEWHDYEHNGAVKDLNSGGNVILLAPGLRVSRGPLSAFASIGIPIATHVNGIQSKTEYRVLTGLAFAF